MSPAAASAQLPPTRLIPGGAPGFPVITAISNGAGQVTLSWTGFTGPYAILASTNLATASWQTVSNVSQPGSITIPQGSHPTFYRITGSVPDIAGARMCGSCHVETYSTWSGTPHAMALDTLKDQGQDTNPDCIVCHTTSFGVPTGFKNETATPNLAGVQCESCHGPAGAHAGYSDDPKLKPIANVTAEICGGCHQNYNQPQYEEWALSGHARVNPTVAKSIRQNGEASMKSCGACHSGAVRVALVRGLALPKNEVAATSPITCAACHECHYETPYKPHLRNPVASTNFFSFSMAADVPFLSQYNEEINLCGQCHNSRGATWQSPDSAPHRSQQYNMYVGNVGVGNSDPAPASTHRDIPTQCVRCHQHAFTPDTPTVDNPRQTGHSFQVNLDGCLPCHITGAAVRIATTQNELRQRINDLKVLLNTWANTQSPNTLRVKYGNLAWEYTTPGPLSNPSGDSAIAGPDASEQALIPDAVKQARFNLYLVQQDGSFGVHNGKYARYLLQVAEDKLNSLLAPP